VRQVGEHDRGRANDVKRIIESANDLTIDEIRAIVAGNVDQPSGLADKRMALVFLSPSTRTRLSFFAALHELGVGHLCLSAADLRYSDGESLDDTALAISQYTHLIGLRITGDDSTMSPTATELPFSANRLLRQFAEASDCSVVNMECDRFHPCQGLADLKTLLDLMSPESLEKVTISWAYSPTALRVPAIPIELCTLFPRFFKNVVLACPEEFLPPQEYLGMAINTATRNGTAFSITHDFKDGLDGTDVIYARNWVTAEATTHGPTAEKQLHRKYSDWRVSESALKLARPSVRYMHCMPVHRGYEAEDGVIDGDHSLVQHQMRNRTKVQKELIKLLLA
jgi:ornithine carbamoyltransferase